MYLLREQVGEMSQVATKHLDDQVKGAQCHHEIAHFWEFDERSDDGVYHARFDGYTDDRWRLKAKGTGIRDSHSADDARLDQLFVATANGCFRHANLSGNVSEGGSSVLLQGLQNEPVQFVHIAFPGVVGICYPAEFEYRCIVCIVA